MSKICKVLEVARSNIYSQLDTVAEKTKKRIRSNEAELLAEIDSIIDKRPTYGYRRVTAVLRKRLEKAINYKCTYRLMKKNALLLPKYAKRPTRVHDGKISTLKSNLRWCSDYFGIQCWNGERLQVIFALDCCDREIMSWSASSAGIDSTIVCDLMVDCITSRFGAMTLPHCIQWLTDNGPGYVARQTLSFGRLLGFEMCTTAPYSPESNGMAEAFVKTFKRDYVYVGDLSTARKVLSQLSLWFEDYNDNAPHKSLHMRSPREYLRASQEDLEGYKYQLTS